MFANKSISRIFSVLFILVFILAQVMPAYAAGSWISTGALTQGRSDHTATLLGNGQVLVVGGFNNSYLSSAELYDPTTGIWTATGALTGVRAYYTATLLGNGQVLVVGGLGSGGALSSVELYDPATGIWTATGALAQARWLHTATLLANGKVLVVGGGDNNSNALASAELYDPATGIWTSAGALTGARRGHTATLLTNGLVLVVGGAGGSIFSSAELYDPTTGIWTATGALNQARHSHTATLLSNGQVLVVGGSVGFGGAIASTELYNSNTGAWTTTGALTQVRYSHTATMLSNGEVLVVGGHNGSFNGFASAEVYDSATGIWTSTGALTESRRGHTATLLSNGQALVVGGIGASDYLASAELYNPPDTIAPAVSSILRANANPTNAASVNFMVTFSVSVTGVDTSDFALTTTGVTGASVTGISGSGAMYTVSVGTGSGTGTIRLDVADDDSIVDGASNPLGGTSVGNGNFTSGESYLIPVPWISTGTLIGGRQEHTATLLTNGKVLVVGGYRGGYLDSAELYNPATGTWTSTSSLIGPRNNHTATLLANGKVLVVGGNGSSGHLASAELYDPATGTWTSTGALNGARNNYTATLLANGQVLVVGGYSPTGVLASAELYDPATGIWTSTGALIQSRYAHTATTLANGKVLIAAGFGPSGARISAELYDPATGLWTSTGQLNGARYYHTATLLANGQALAVGGFGTSYNTLSNAELYDPTTGTWTPTAALTRGRESHTATLLPNGQVMVVGGFYGSGALSSAELYDPATGLWTSTGILNAARYFHTATLLPNRQVLVVGGYGGGTLATAELYGDSMTVDQTITVTTHAPVSAANGSSFTVEATASSGLPVLYSASGACTNLNTTFTIISGTGDCIVMYDQAGDASYNPAPQVIEMVADANDAPVITEGASVEVSMSEDIATSFNLTLHATDPDNDPLTWSIAAPALHGAAVADGVGFIQYTPNTDYNGTDSFEVRVDDGTLTDTITVNVTINPVNDAPVITEGASVNVAMSMGGSPTPFDLTLHATDIDSGITTLTWSISSAPLYGVAAVVTGASPITGSTGTTSYTPNTGYMGIDSFEVRVTDGSLVDIITVNVTVRPVLTVIADSQRITYGDAEPSFRFAYTGFVGADGPTNVDTPPTCGRVGAFSRNVGTYRIGCSGGADDKYDFRYVDNELTINPKPITIRADAQTKVYGMADPALTYQVTSGALESGDSFTGDLTRASGENVGVFAILQGTLTAGSNYNLTYIPGGELTITAKPITVTADPQSKVYGTVDPLLTYQVTSGALESGDSFTGALTRVSGENVDTYAISQDTLSANSNYILTFVGADFTISKADQNITVITNAPASAVIGDSFTVAAVSSSGLSVTYNSSGTCTNAGADFTMTGGIGTCTVDYDQAGDSNYNPAPQVTENVTALSNVPDLLTPANAEQLLNNRPTFDWTDVSGALSYTIQVSNNVGFTSPTSNTVMLSTYTQPTSLPAGVTRYWRVQATRIGGPGPWSVIRSFVTASPPSAPTLASPANNALVTDYTPLLDWNDSTIPAGITFLKYELQIATDNAFTSPTSVEVSGAVTNSDYTPSTDMDSNTMYYWRGRAYNTLGQYSAWSAVRSFRTALLPPTLVTPNDAEQMLVNRPTFEWDDVAGATGYRIQISNNVGFTSTLTNATVTSSTYTRTSDLPFGVTLYWRVRSNGTNGPSAWSEVRSLTTTNPPSAPTLASPANNAKVSGPSPLFNWNDSTLPVGVVFDHYQIQIATSNAFTTIVYDNNVAGLVNSQDNTAVLLPATTYYWRVRAFNTLGHASAWSTVRNVRINFAGPTLTQPGTGTTISSLTPTFIWDAVSGATDYTIQVSKSNTFSPLVFSRTATSPTYTHTANLQAGTTYYWRVRVRGPNTYGPGDWSQVFTFTTP